MKKIILFIFLLVSNILLAQISKSLGDFNKVTAFDKISVKLVSSNENRIEIKGDLASEVQIITKNKELKIRMPLEHLMKGDDVNVILYFKKLEAIEANEGSSISCDSNLKALDFNLIAKEGADIKVAIDAQRITLKSSNGAVITLSGKAQNLEAIVSSGGILEAQKLETNQTVISVNAGGNADVFATDLVDAKVRAGGNITIFGNPKQVNQKTVIAGNIKIIKNN